MLTQGVKKVEPYLYMSKMDIGALPRLRTQVSFENRGHSLNQLTQSGESGIGLAEVVAVAG